MRSSSLFKDYSLLASSGLFDAEYYRRQNPGLATHVDPLLHYLERGGPERRDPGPRFSTAYYLEQCQARGETPENPLLHFLTIGVAQGLLPLPGEGIGEDVRLAIDSPLLVDGRARLADGAASLIISGWALAAEGVDGIEVSVDHALACRGLSRYQASRRCRLVSRLCRCHSRRFRGSPSAATA